ncbi:MAG: 50S ribosomal protein L29 [Calditrichaeota bacterium]|nr:50S ribosomal protein L29 [Calditrichota bacterium]RQV92357.1 MAG: 50S ribosomal protein L29 [bacterium]RQV98700.1 MAG: 50S ribosomal protein L29 [Calditrichota bacterium]
MKIQEIRELPVDELKARLEDFKDELANLNIQKATHQLANPSRIKMVKKNISRINCILREYELGISKPRTETKA